MAFGDVVIGLQSWSDYISNADQARTLDRSLTKHQAGIVSSVEDVGLAIAQYQRASAASTERLAFGIAQLNADFNLFLGEAVWLLQLQGAYLRSILATLQAPLDTAAKELRRRAEDAYRHGWYEEALSDFVESGVKNYQDFTVHRSIGNIHLFQRREPLAAVEHFRRAAKYALPIDQNHAAEAHLFAGIALAVSGQFDDAAKELSVATDLNPDLSEGHYVIAVVAATRGDAATMQIALRQAIRRDSRYLRRAQNDIALGKMSEPLRQLCWELEAVERDAIKSNVALARQALADLEIDSSFPEVRAAISSLDRRLETIGSTAQMASYDELLELRRQSSQGVSASAVAVELRTLLRTRPGLVERATQTERRMNDADTFVNALRPHEPAFRLQYWFAWHIGTVLTVIVFWGAFVSTDPGTEQVPMFVAVLFILGWIPWLIAQVVGDNRIRELTKRHQEENSKRVAARNAATIECAQAQEDLESCDSKTRSLVSRLTL